MEEAGRGRELGELSLLLLALKIEEAATSQGIQAVSGSEGKGKAIDSSLRLPEGMQPDDALT